MPKVYSFPAKSTQKVAKTLEYCLGKAGIKSTGYMGVFNRNIFSSSKYKWVYYVVEWILTDDEIDYINTFPKVFIPGSNFVKFLSRNYRFPPVLHEVPIDFLNANIRRVDKRYDFMAVTYSLVRKTPYIMLKFLNKTKHKGVVVGDFTICNHLKNPNVKCINFGVNSEEDMKELYQASKTFVFLSGNEGFGLPPLEATYMGLPVIAYPFMPFLEWHKRDSFTIPDKLLQVKGVYQHGTLHPVVLPKDGYDDNVIEFVEDMIGHSADNNTIDSIHYVKENMTYCKEFGKIVDILLNYGIT